MYWLCSVFCSVCGYAYREWLPNAKAVYLFGDFNNWDRSSHPLKRERRAVAPSFFEASLGALKGVKADLLAEQAPGEQLSSVWSIFIPDNSDGSPALSHRCASQSGDCTEVTVVREGCTVTVGAYMAPLSLLFAATSGAGLAYSWLASKPLLQLARLLAYRGGLQASMRDERAA